MKHWKITMFLWSGVCKFKLCVLCELKKRKRIRELMWDVSLQN